MKESENVSLFIASFYEKKFLKLYFSYFREEINSTQGFMKKLSITILFLVHPTFRVIRQSCRAYNLSLK